MSCTTLVISILCSEKRTEEDGSGSALLRSVEIGTDRLLSADIAGIQVVNVAVFIVDLMSFIF